MRHAFTLVELLVVLAIIAVLCALLDGVALDVLIGLSAGWVLYPVRLVQEREIDWPSTLLCAACLVIFTLGVHHFGQWFAAHRTEPSAWTWPRTLKLVGMVMLLFLAGITTIGVTHEVFWMATSKQPMMRRISSDARTWSRNNMTQIGVAAHNFHEVRKHLPPGATLDSQGRALHGWQTFLLPYIEQEPIHRQIDFTQPWNAPVNAIAIGNPVPPFLHPARDQDQMNGQGLSHYAGNVHVLGAKPMTFNQITDGMSNTLLSGEVAHNFKPWGMPMNCRDPAVGFNTPSGFASLQGHSVLFLFADGTVRNLAADISPDVLRALSTPRGGEAVDPDDIK